MTLPQPYNKVNQVAYLNKTALYGVDFDNLIQASRILEEDIGFKLVHKNSIFWGEYYTEPTYNEFRLYYNQVPASLARSDNDQYIQLHEEDANYACLLYLDEKLEIIERLESSLGKLAYLKQINSSIYNPEG